MVLQRMRAKQGPAAFLAQVTKLALQTWHAATAALYFGYRAYAKAARPRWVRKRKRKGLLMGERMGMGLRTWTSE